MKREDKLSWLLQNINNIDQKFYESLFGGSPTLRDLLWLLSAVTGFEVPAR
jgi:hypothetical protein